MNKFSALLFVLAYLPFYHRKKAHRTYFPIQHPFGLPHQLFSRIEALPMFTRIQRYLVEQNSHLAPIVHLLNDRSAHHRFCTNFAYPILSSDSILRTAVLAHTRNP